MEVRTHQQLVFHHVSCCLAGMRGSCAAALVPSSTAASLQSALIRTTEAILDVVFVPVVAQPALQSEIYWLHVWQLHAVAAIVTFIAEFAADRAPPIRPGVPYSLLEPKVLFG